ncbi:FUSC family protein [Nonomuraea sp. NPDC050556]|uniref:FUSC family protein n=1 Tax=Nonomuraea sp. NPDC050556 TaxID=3364369 RepID=UPI00379E6609
MWVARVRHWFGVVVPPWRLTMTAVVLLIPVATGLVAAYLTSGTVAALALVFVFLSVVGAAMSLPVWPDYVLVSLTAVAGCVGGLLAAGHTGWSVTVVSLAALLQYFFNRRTVAAASMLPVTVFVLASAPAGQPVLPAALWAAAGAALALLIFKLAKVHGSPKPLDRVTALRHALLLTACCAVLTWIALETRFVHGLWLILTLCLVFVPHPDQSRRRAVDRIIATISGGAASAIVLLTIPNRGVVVALGLACIILSVAWSLKDDVPYRNSVFWTTPGALLLAGAGSVATLVMDRVLVTIAIALLAGLLAVRFLP